MCQYTQDLQGIIGAESPLSSNSTNEVLGPTVYNWTKINQSCSCRSSFPPSQNVSIAYSHPLKVSFFNVSFLKERGWTLCIRPPPSLSIFLWCLPDYSGRVCVRLSAVLSDIKRDGNEPLEPHMVERSHSGLYTPVFYVIVGKAFAENSCYFLQKPFPQKGNWG